MKLTFENAAFADIVSRAASVAPKSGAALDVSPGILIECQVNDALPEPVVTLRSTNGELYYREWTDLLDAEDVNASGAAWLVSSFRLDALSKTLPIGSGRVVTLSDESPGYLTLSSGAMKSLIPLNRKVDFFPNWPVFDPDTLNEVTGFSDIVAKVGWAAADGAAVPLNGIHFDGEYAVATDRYRLVVMPCALNTDEPFTVPGLVLSSLIKTAGSRPTRAAFYDGHLYVMPSESAQIMVINYDKEYVRWQKAMRTDHTDRVTVDKQEISSIIKRVKSIIQTDRQGRILVRIGVGRMMFASQDTENTKIMDVLETPGAADHAPVDYWFGPDNLIRAIDNAPTDRISIDYWAIEPPTMAMWRIESDGGYAAWVAPRRKEKDGT